MNANSNTFTLLKTALFLVLSLFAFATSVTYAIPVTRVVPTVIKIDSFSDFKHFDIAGATELKVASINDSGQVAGQYTDLSGRPHFFLYNPHNDHMTVKDFTVEVPSIIDSNNLGQILGSAYNLPFTHLPVIYSFVYSDQSITRLDGPDDSTALGSSAKGINNLGQVVGIDYSGSQIRGYIYDINNKKYTIFDFPPPYGNSKPHTFAPAAVTGINDSAQVIGSLSNPSNYQLSGFVYNNGAFDIFKVGNQHTLPISINNNGQVVGVYGRIAQAGIGQGGLFIYQEGKLMAIKPKAKLAGNLTLTHRINDSGQIVGYTLHYETGALQSYLYSNGIFAILSIPDALSTLVSDINNSGQIAGTYTDAAGAHGFIATPIIATPVRDNLDSIQIPLR